MPPDAPFRTSADVLGDRTSPVEPGSVRPIPPQRGAADQPPGEAAPVPTPELVEQMAEQLYNSLDPRFVDRDWQDATDGARQWARGRAQRLLAEGLVGPSGALPAPGRGLG